MREMLFMGIDAGTQGVRAVVADQNGRIIAANSVAYGRLNTSDEPERYEQSPDDWWDAAKETIGACITQMRGYRISAEDIAAISIDGTSGTIVPLGRDNRPLCNALMYNDLRARQEAARVSRACAELEEKLGLRYGASFSLPRILWIRENLPEIYEKAALIVHQADYLTGCLCGEYDFSDYSNALKTGYDLVDGEWPAVIASLGIDAARLPRIVAPGAPIANIAPSIAQALGLSPRTLVTGGSTDGYASALAAGAARPGDWASIVGTTFVLKGVTEKLVKDPSGSAYSHMLPSGTWLLGGASNAGGRCLNNRFCKEEFERLNASVDAFSPTGTLIYPLTGIGERFPFVDPDAREFIVGKTDDPKVLYAALMEGVGYLERLAYERMECIGCRVGDAIFTSGGACCSDEWLSIRASILQKQLKVPAVVDAAMGSAMIAASGWFGALEKAVEAMIGFAKTVEPVTEKIDRFDELYAEFRQECKKRFHF